MATITHHAGRETRRPPIARRTLTVAALVAFLPGALFAAGVVTMGRWGVPLWPHQLWFWLLGASILGPLVAASIVRRWLWSSMFVLASLIALLMGGDLQLGLAHDMWDTCPGTNQPDGWERQMESSVLRAEATCIYIDPRTGREVDRNGFTMFDRVRGVF